VINRFYRFMAGIAGRSHLAPEAGFSLRGNQFMRFLAAGGVNTLFGFAVYSVFIMAGMEVWLSLLAGTVLGTIFNFFTTGGYAFRKLAFSRFPRFVMCYLLVYGVNFTLLRLLSGWLDHKILSQAILALPMALLAYFLMARFVFSRETNG
jgi:putative flippase GtrA